MTKGKRSWTHDMAESSSVGQLRRRVVSWIGLILLALNVLGGGIISARAAEGGKPLSAQDVFGERMVICTTAGMVVIDTDGNVVDPDGDGGNGNLCTFCLPMMHGGAGIAAAQEAPLPLQSRDRGLVPPRQADTVDPNAPIGIASPRAPPLS